MHPFNGFFSSSLFLLLFFFFSFFCNKDDWPRTRHRLNFFLFPRISRREREREREGEKYILGNFFSLLLRTKLIFLPSIFKPSIRMECVLDRRYRYIYALSCGCRRIYVPSEERMIKYKSNGAERYIYSRCNDAKKVGRTDDKCTRIMGRFFPFLFLSQADDWRLGNPGSIKLLLFVMLRSPPREKGRRAWRREPDRIPRRMEERAT